MDQVLFVAEINELKKDLYVKYHKEMSKQFLMEKKAFGEVREFIWLVGNKAIVYLEVENFDEFMKNSSGTETFKKWVEKFKDLIVGEWQMPEKTFDFENQLKNAFLKEIGK